MKGSLKRNVAGWEKLTNDSFILSVVKDGYAPPFKRDPPAFFKKNNVNALREPVFLVKAVAELLVNGFARLTKTPPKVVNPFSVSVQSNGKKRLIADLHHLNLFLDPPKFKMDDLKAAMPAILQSNYMFSFDVQKGYYHVDLAEEIQELFGFSFSVNGEKYFGHYTVMPFGLSIAPFLFTKLLRPFVSKYRSLGLHIFIFIDDALALCKTKAEAEYFSPMLRRDLQETGVTEQTSKSIWDAVTVLIWLGILIDLARRKLSVPEKKREKALEALKKCLQRDKVSPRFLAKVAGLISSLQPVLGGKAYIHTKQFCKKTVAYARSKYLWDKDIKISEETRKCARFWLRELGKGTLEKNFELQGHSVLIFSDASGTGGASYLQTGCISAASVGDADKVRNTDKAVVMWSQKEANESSTWREVKTIEAGLDAFKHRLRNRSVLWHTDNLPGVSTITKGSMKPTLNPLAESINRICEENNIQLEVKWLRRDLNKVADKLSRFIDLDDWAISDEFFQDIQKMWNCWCTVDRFASQHNKKLARYNSRFESPDSEATDTFTQQWTHETNWTVPPPTLIPKVLDHIQQQRAKGILIVPNWCTSRYWPFIFTSTGRLPCIKKQLLVKKGASILVAGKQPNTIFTPEKFKSGMLALLYDATTG